MGVKIEVMLELDEEPRTVEIPSDLASVLAKKAGTIKAFDALAPLKRRDYMRHVVAARAQAIRERRIVKIVSDQSNGQ